MWQLSWQPEGTFSPDKKWDFSPSCTNSCSYTCERQTEVEWCWGSCKVEVARWEIPAVCWVEERYDFSFLSPQASGGPLKFIWFYRWSKKKKWKQSCVNTPLLLLLTGGSNSHERAACERSITHIKDICLWDDTAQNILYLKNTRKISFPSASIIWHRQFIMDSIIRVKLSRNAISRSVSLWYIQIKTHTRLQKSKYCLHIWQITKL